VVPDFELPDEKGEPRRLSQLLVNGCVVLFFYPSAGSRGCSVETRHFQDLIGEFAKSGAQVVGISRDQISKQLDFSERCSLDFPLLSDSRGVVAASLGVKRRFGPIAVKRWTFVIDTGRQVFAVIKSETHMSAHADRALEAVRLLRAPDADGDTS